MTELKDNSFYLIPKRNDNRRTKIKQLGEASAWAASATTSDGRMAGKDSAPLAVRGSLPANQRCSSAEAAKQPRGGRGPSKPALEHVAEPAGALVETVVRLHVESETVGLGLVVDEAGHMLSKLSEVGMNPPHLDLERDLRRYTGKMIAGDDFRDVALIRIDADGLMPVEVADEQPDLGEFVAAVNEVGEPWGS